MRLAHPFSQKKALGKTEKEARFIFRAWGFFHHISYLWEIAASINCAFILLKNVPVALCFCLEFNYLLQGDANDLYFMVLRTKLNEIIQLVSCSASAHAHWVFAIGPVIT